MPAEKQTNRRSKLFALFCLPLSFLLLFAMLTGCEKEHFTLSILAQGEESSSIPTNARIVRSISLDRLEYDFSDETSELSEISGVISLNATVEANAPTASIQYLSSQPEILLYFPGYNSPSDMKSIIQRGKRELRLEKGESSSYVRLGLIVRTNTSKKIEKGPDPGLVAASTLINSLNEDFMEVRVTFENGAVVAKKYALFAEDVESDATSYYLKESD